MKPKMTQEQEQVSRLLREFNRMPNEVRESVIWYASGVADAMLRQREVRHDR